MRPYRKLPSAAAWGIALVGLLLVLLAGLYQVSASPLPLRETPVAQTEDLQGGLFSSDDIAMIVRTDGSSLLQTEPVGTIMSQGFEGTWPAAGWQVFDESSQDGGEYLFGKRNCHPRTGNYGGWSVGGGAQGSALPCSGTYPNNARTWAVYGPFNLTQASSASLTFHVWGQVQGGGGSCPSDYMFVGSSADGSSFRGSGYCGDATDGPDGNGYYRVTYDLASRVGQSQVWIAFVFVSDGSVTFGGFTIDDLTLQTDGGPTNTPTRTATRTPTPTRSRTATPTPTATPTDGTPAPPVEGLPHVEITEIVFNPEPGEPEWVEIRNLEPFPIAMAGFTITDEDGNIFRLPDALPPVPPNAFVVVMFDGLGSEYNDYDFVDNRAIIHAPAWLIDIFEDDIDQVALYRFGFVAYLPTLMRGFSSPVPPVPRPDTDITVPSIISFVGWGGSPEEDDDTAAAAGIWTEDAFVDTIQQPGGDGLIEGGSIGVTVGGTTGSPSDWFIYQPEEVGQAIENDLPAPFVRNPPNLIVTCDRQIVFGWSNVAGAEQYRLEIDDDVNFGSPLVAVNLSETSYRPPSPLPEGMFRFRIKAFGADDTVSAFSHVGTVTFLECPTLASANPSARVLLDVSPKLQHKDTLMLNLDGNPETGQGRWDSAHETDGDLTVGDASAVRATPLDDWYCTRASISMIVAYHGGNLSQDRISFYAYGDGPPEGDLGHGIGLWPNQLSTWNKGKNVFDWAMNGNTVISNRGKPTFAEVQGWINAGRPLLVVENNDRHSVVLDGFDDTGQLAHRVDPWTATGSWVSYSSWNISEYHVPPANVTPRSDEDVDNDGIRDTVDDSDGDGISDFDERNRFRGNLRNLDANNPDSDGDLVPDKLDMREYMFDAAGNYSKRAPDWDSDGDRKETDPDNDNFWDVGSIDGCEDSNHNGRLDAQETSNFDPRQGHEKVCPAPQVDITSPASGSTDDDCVIRLQGTVASDTALTSLSALVTSGPQSNRFNLAWTGSSPSYSFDQELPLYSGDNTILVNAVNEFGSDSDYINVSCSTEQVDIHVQLSWTQLGSDFDLHLIRPGGAYWSIPDDCHWRNMNPDWGVPGDDSDDPRLDIDCITQCRLENIVLSKPENGMFTVKVHYYSDHGLGPASPTVRIWVRGVRYDFGPQYMTDEQVWDVATIDWPPGTLSVIDEVRDGPEAGELPARIKR